MGTLGRSQDRYKQDLLDSNPDTTPMEAAKCASKAAAYPQCMAEHIRKMGLAWAQITADKVNQVSTVELMDAALESEWLKPFATTLQGVNPKRRPLIEEPMLASLGTQQLAQYLEQREWR